MNKMNELKTYQLMYFFGVWICKETINAETAEEAIFDADAIYNGSCLNEWPHPVALWRGKKIVKYYHGRPND